MSKRNAWILDLGNEQRAAVSERELLHVIYEPKTFVVPLTPPHCRRVLAWAQQIVPAMDVDVLIAPRALDRAKTAVLEGAKRFAGIVGYQRRRGEPVQYGALLLATPPRRVQVDDRQACALPTGLWREVALACFDDGNGPIPILDFNRVFSGQVGRANSRERAAA